MGDATSEGRKSALKGRLVEGVRMIFIALFATGGYELGSAVTTSASRTLCMSSSAQERATSSAASWDA